MTATWKMQFLKEDGRQGTSMCLPGKEYLIRNQVMVKWDADHVGMVSRKNSSGIEDKQLMKSDV